VVWLSCRATSGEETDAQTCGGDGLMNPILRIVPHTTESLGCLMSGFTLLAPEGQSTPQSFTAEFRSSFAISYLLRRRSLGMAWPTRSATCYRVHSSVTGLMRAQWDTSDWGLADVKQLRFAGPEAIAMRSEVARRTKQIQAKACPGYQPQRQFLLVRRCSVS